MCKILGKPLGEPSLGSACERQVRPLVGDFDVYYKTEEGSYPFSYVDHNGVQHPLLGEYSVVNIFSDKGEKGGLFNSGEDGEDVYVDLILLSTGAVIENYDMFTIASSLDYPE